MHYCITQSGFGFLLESRKQRKAARKEQQAWVSRARNRESTPFLAQVHQALSTGVGPKDKKTGKIQDLSQWQGHAAQEGKKSTGTIDVIGNPAHRRAALQSGRESRFCVGTACKELVGQFAHETTKDLSKTAANRQSRALHQGTQSPEQKSLTRKATLQRKIDRPDPEEREVSEDLEASRPNFRKFLLDLGHRRRTEKATKGKVKRKIPQNLKGKALADALRQADIEGLGFKGPMGRGLNEIGDTKRGSDYIDATVQKATKDVTDADKEAEASPANPIADTVRRLRRMQIDRVMSGALGGRIYLDSRTGRKAQTKKERDAVRLKGQTAGREAATAGHVENPQKFTDLVRHQKLIKRVQDPNDPTPPSGSTGRMFKLARSHVKTQGRIAKYKSN